MPPFLLRRAIFWATVFGIGLVFTLLIMPTVANVSEKAHRAVDAANLRKIGQASVLYALDHGDQLPRAEDVWAYARLLADDGGLIDATVWQSRNDPATKNGPLLSSVIVTDAPKPRPLDPGFRALKPSVAVPLGKLHARMPPTTPIAWTRGLQPDGRWSPHSPFGDHGGYIMFLGGNVSFFLNLGADGGGLLRFDGKGQTADILEALPPGTRIGEYIPSPEEQKAWASTVSWRASLGPLPPHAHVMFLAALWVPFLAIFIYRLLKRQRRAFLVLLWPLVLSALLVLITRDAW